MTTFKDMAKLVLSDQKKNKERSSRQLAECAAALLYLPAGPARLHLDALVATAASGQIDRADLLDALREAVDSARLDASALLARAASSAECADGLRTDGLTDGPAEGPAREARPPPTLPALVLLQAAEAKLRDEYGRVHVSELGHGSFLDLLGLLDRRHQAALLYAGGRHAVANGGGGGGDDDGLALTIDDTVGSGDAQVGNDCGELSDVLSEATVLSAVSRALSHAAATADEADEASPTANQGSAFALLKRVARVEGSVLQALGRPSFSELGHGASLAAFVTRHGGGLGPACERAFASAGALGSRRVDPTDLFAFVDAFLEASGLDASEAKAQAALGPALVAVFGLGSTGVASLGFGELPELLRRRQRRGPVRASSSRAFVQVEALLAGVGAAKAAPSASAAASAPADAFAADAASAAQCLAAAPFLVDLGAWVDWDQRQAPSLGQLKDFLRVASADPALSGAISTFGCFSVGPSSSPTLMKYDLFASRDKLRAALAKEDPHGAATQLVSLLVGSQGGFVSELATVETIVLEPALKAMFGRAASKALSALCAFAVATLRHVPGPHLRRALAPFVVDPLFHAKLDASHAQVQEALIAACRDLADRSMLHQVGRGRATREGVVLSVLADDFDRCLVRTPEAEAAAAAAAASAATTAAAAAAAAAATAEALSLSPLQAEASAASNDPDRDIDPVSQAEEEGGEEEGGFVFEADESLPLSSQGAEPGKQGGASAQNLKPSEVIRDIRERTFKIGPSGFQHGEPDILDRALEKLSADLYSKETHFILELVQNADDNVRRTCLHLVDSHIQDQLHSLQSYPHRFCDGLFCRNTARK